VRQHSPGTHVAAQRQQELLRLLDMNRQALVGRCVQSYILAIPQLVAEWGDAVLEPRPLHVENHERPWQATIATIKTKAAMTQIFGIERRRTYPMKLAVQKCARISIKEIREINMTPRRWGWRWEPIIPSKVSSAWVGLVHVSASQFGTSCVRAL